MPTPYTTRHPTRSVARVSVRVLIIGCPHSRRSSSTQHRIESYKRPPRTKLLMCLNNEWCKPSWKIIMGWHWFFGSDIGLILYWSNVSPMELTRVHSHYTKFNFLIKYRHSRVHPWGQIWGVIVLFLCHSLVPHCQQHMCWYNYNDQHDMIRNCVVTLTCNNMFHHNMDWCSHYTVNIARHCIQYGNNKGTDQQWSHRTPLPR